MTTFDLMMQHSRLPKLLARKLLKLIEGYGKEMGSGCGSKIGYPKKPLVEVVEVGSMNRNCGFRHSQVVLPANLPYHDLRFYIGPAEQAEQGMVFQYKDVGF